MDYLIDAYYELYLSDFLDESEIAELVVPRELTNADMDFWRELLNG